MTNDLCCMASAVAVVPSMLRYVCHAMRATLQPARGIRGRAQAVGKASAFSSRLVNQQAAESGMMFKSAPARKLELQFCPQYR